MRDTIAMHKGEVQASPEAVGYDAQKLELLNQHYSNLISKGVLQGASYLISKGGHIIARNSLGKLRSSESSPDLLPESIRKTYSITKAFTAVAIGQLIDRGLIYLHQPVSSILPEFDTDKHREITIFSLLTHTSGISGDPGFYNEPYTMPWFEWAVHELKKEHAEVNWKQIILSGPLQRKPGKEWIYCTSGFSILGEVIAKISGKSYEQYIQEEILEPIGMERSFFQVPVELADEVLTTNEWEEEQVNSPRPRAEDAPPRAGNGLYSTLDDLWKFGQMMLNKGEFNGNRILSTRSVEIQTANHLRKTPHRGWGNNERDYQFGLGWSLEHYDICSPGTFSHEGFGHCGLFIDPVEQLVFVFFVPSHQGFSFESVVTPRSIVWSGIL